MSGVTGSAARRRAPGSESAGREWFWRNLRTYGIVVSLVLLVAGFSIATPFFGSRFHTLNNIQTMATQMVVISLCSVGMTVVIISGGIDLSVGSVIALSMVVTAWLIEWLLGRGWSLSAAAAVAAAGGVATGGVAGLANGAMITAFRIVPFIATLGMMGIARGLAKLIARHEHINIDVQGSWFFLLNVNPSVGGAPAVEGLPYLPGWLLFAPGFWLLLAVAAFMALVLKGTVFGRRVFAVGSNEAAARLCGVRVTRLKVLIYTLSGAFTGMAGVVLCSRQSQGDPTAALGYELDVIAAVVIGGGSLNGGEGSILGSLAGAVIMIVLRTGLRMVNAPAPVQEILIGAIIIVAVVVDQLQHARGE